MSKCFQKALAASLLSGLALTACVDNNYDLSNLDTTTEVVVKDLVIPINVDELQLKSIVDLGDTETIEVINGEYCFVEEGSFESEEVIINDINFVCDNITPTTKTFNLAGIRPEFIQHFDVEFDLSTPAQTFEMKASGVPECIVSIDEVSGDVAVDLRISLIGFENNLKSFKLKNCKIKLPKGLMEVSGDGTYDAEQGIYSIPDVNVTGCSVNFHIEVGRINFAASGLIYDTETHSIIFEDEIGVISAVVVVSSSDLKNLDDMPESVTFMANYDIKAASLNTFTGSFNYSIDNFSIPRVDLSDLPDLLAQSGTDVKLANPQLYLTVKNPSAAQPLKAQAGLEVAAIRNGKVDQRYPMDTPLEFLPLPVASYCVSPAKPESYIAGYDNAIYHPYTMLGKILSGDGIPEALEVTVVNPTLPTQRVVDFAIGDVGNVSGSYKFFAPLQLGAGSQIVYGSEETGWGDEDLDKLTINSLKVSALVTTDIPVNIHLTGYPVDRKGDKIGSSEIEGATVPANAKDYPLTITINGPIQKLDGIVYRAVAATLNDKDAATLNENMTISLKNLRVTVDGAYLTEI